MELSPQIESSSSDDEDRLRLPSGDSKQVAQAILAAIIQNRYKDVRLALPTYLMSTPNAYDRSVEIISELANMKDKRSRPATFLVAEATQFVTEGAPSESCKERCKGLAGVLSSKAYATLLKSLGVILDQHTISTYFNKLLAGNQYKEAVEFAIGMGISDQIEAIPLLTPLVAQSQAPLALRLIDTRTDSQVPPTYL